MSKIKKGSCSCGEIQFMMEGDFDKFFLCHCKYCQKDTGSAFAANLFSSSASITWEKGREKVRVFKLKNTRHIRTFCSLCGSALPSIQNDGELIVVPAGCLDTDVQIVPNAHLFVSRKASWEEGLMDIKSYEELPKE